MTVDVKNKRLILKFDKKKFNFKKLFSSYLGKLYGSNLSKIHNKLDSKYLPKEIVKESNDQKLSFYDVLYKIDPGYNLQQKYQDEDFLKKYKEFVEFLSNEVFQEKLIYQFKPTLRVQFPGNKAVGGWHRDREYNHPSEEINIWVPITKARETSAIWVESSFNAEDYSPVNIDFGEVLIFDSGLKHGNKVNQTNNTRLSFDFRIIPYSKFSKQTLKIHRKSVAQEIEFSIGKYYSLT